MSGMKTSLITSFVGRLFPEAPAKAFSNRSMVSSTGLWRHTLEVTQVLHRIFKICIFISKAKKIIGVIKGGVIWWSLSKWLQSGEFSAQRIQALWLIGTRVKNNDFIAFHTYKGFVVVWFRRAVSAYSHLTV